MPEFGYAYEHAGSPGGSSRRKKNLGESKKGLYTVPFAKPIMEHPSTGCRRSIQPAVYKDRVRLNLPLRTAPQGRESAAGRPISTRYFRGISGGR
jgi:hypothetical protein